MSRQDRADIYGKWYAREMDRLGDEIEKQEQEFRKQGEREMSKARHLTEKITEQSDKDVKADLKELISKLEDVRPDTNEVSEFITHLKIKIQNIRKGEVSREEKTKFGDLDGFEEIKKLLD